MARNKVALLIALIIAVAAVAGGIVYAQESAAPQVFTYQGPDAEAFGSFDLLFQGGAFLGIRAEEITTENYGRYGLRDVRGVGVADVEKDSPAEKAGIRKDDVIVRFDGESVTSTRKLSRLVAEASPDHTVRLTISRGGAEQELNVTLGKRPGLATVMAPKIKEDVFKNFPKDFPKNGEGSFVFAWGGNRRMGIATQGLTKQLSDYFGAKDGGVLVTSVNENSPAAKAGLKAGDVITAIDGEKVDSPGDISRAINKKEDGNVTLTILRDHNTSTVTVTPEKATQRTIVRPGVGTRRVMIPSIEIPAVPEMDIKIPSITIPATPAIELEVPAPPKVQRTRVVII
jgi:membrane-associated protease RseP (regulator of RpoE activity)